MAAQLRQINSVCRGCNEGRSCDDNIRYEIYFERATFARPHVYVEMDLDPFGVTLLITSD